MTDLITAMQEAGFAEVRDESREGLMCCYGQLPNGGVGYAMITPSEWMKNTTEQRKALIAARVNGALITARNNGG